MLPFALLVAAALLAESVHAADKWNYEYQGEDWQEGQCAEGQSQSPIDIQYTNVVDVHKDKPCIFINYDKLVPVSVRLGHHTVRVTPTCDYEIGIAGCGLQDRYILDHVHFHWGSEHLFDGYRFPMEGHFVHYKSIYNGTDDAAASGDPEAILVFGVLFEEGKDNSELLQIEGGARSGETVIDLEKLLPIDTSRFFRYRGSLTTPPCSEAVLWHVFKTPAALSSLQVPMLRSLLPVKEQLHPTYRVTQKLNRRRVELWSTGFRSIWGFNRVDNVAANPSLLFAVIPGLSNSLHVPTFNRHF